MAAETQKKEILLPNERKMSAKEKWGYTWHEMKRNKMCYIMLFPFMIFFLIFTVIPVVMALPMGFTDFDMAHFPPKWVGFQNFYTMFLEDDVFIGTSSGNQMDTPIVLNNLLSLIHHNLCIFHRMSQ